MDRIVGGQTAELLRPADELFDAYCRSGSTADFDRIARRFAPLVYSECRRVTKRAHDAEDAAQLTFLALAIELRGGGEIRQPAGWLQRVARRQAMKVVRARGRRSRWEDAARRSEVAPPEPTLVETADRDRHAELVREAVDALPATYRLPIVLHYFGGLSLESIAAELKSTRAAVGTRLHRGRKLLSTRLAERGVTLTDGMLATVAATLVPAAVVAALVQAAGRATVATTPGHSIAASIASMLASANVSGSRRLAVAAAVLGASASGFAYVAPPKWLRELPLRIVRQVDWLDELRDAEPAMPTRLLPDLPTLQPPVFGTHGGLFGISGTSSPIAPPPSHAEAIVPPTLPHVVAGDVARPDSIASTPPPLSLPPTMSLDLPNVPRAAIGEPSKNTSPGTTSLGSAGGDLLRITAGGSLRVGTLRVGADAGDRGEVVQTGGDVFASRLVIGDAGEGRYDLRGGTLTAGQITIAARPGSRGTLHVGGGELQVDGDAAPVVVGGMGVGKLLLGTQDEPGRFTTLGKGADAALIVRASEQARGLIQGWGNVGLGGTLTNNGRVVADGFDHLRPLDFSQARAIANTIDNPRDGLSGWFARRGGRITLPAIDVRAGTHTYTWGEDAGDAALDLVNSLRLTVHDQPTPARAAVSLRTIAGADPLDVPLPTGVSILGLWQIDAVGLAGSGLDVTVRYDHASANAIWPGESAIRLLAHVAGKWVEADGNDVDLIDRLVSGWFGGPADLIAVGIFVDDPFRLRDAATSTMRTLSAAGVVPEPTTLGLVLATIVLARRWRRS